METLAGKWKEVGECVFWKRIQKKTLQAGTTAILQRTELWIAIDAGLKNQPNDRWGCYFFLGAAGFF
jgi:hypothetical protein